MNDGSEEKLEEEQEEMLMKFLEMMPESSQETVLAEEDREQVSNNGIVFFGGSVCCGKEERRTSTEVSWISRGAAENRGGNVAKGHWKIRQEFAEEENDSGFATSSEHLLKVSTPVNLAEDKFMHEDMNSDDSDLCSDSGDSCKSMESVALLQNAPFLDKGGNCESGEPCVSTLNVKPFQSVPDDEDKMQIDEERLHSTDKSVQTVRFVSEFEEHGGESSDFLRSLINLKYIVLSDKEESSKRYLDILENSNQTKEVYCEESGNGTGEVDNEKWSWHCQGFEDFKSSAKSERNPDKYREAGTTNMDDIMLKSVDSILVWLKNEMKKNCRHFCNYWHGSVRADSVDMIIQVVDLHSGPVRTKVSQFLIDIFDEIYESDSPFEDAILECKTAFLSCFRKSVLLSYDLIEHVSGKLHQFASPRSGGKFHMMTLVKKNYFSLRLMSDLLDAFLSHLQTDGVQSVFGRKSPEDEPNVLNLWTRDRKRDISGETDGLEIGIRYIQVMARWCHRTDQVFQVCLREIPMLLKSAHACNLLAQDIIFYQDGILKKLKSST